MSLTKTNLIESIQNQINLPKTQSAAFVESILEIIKRTLSEKLVIKNPFHEDEFRFGCTPNHSAHGCCVHLFFN